MKLSNTIQELAPIEWKLPACPCRASYATKPHAERMRIISVLTKHWAKML